MQDKKIDPAKDPEKDAQEKMEIMRGTFDHFSRRLRRKVCGREDMQSMMDRLVRRQGK